MIVEQQKVSIERSADFKGKLFGIKLSPDAYRTLIFKQYSDGITAIIRELSTNAFDSHVDNKNPEEPFLVHLPNRFEPFFSVRDYGTGMSPETVEEIYTEFFASNKRDSNEKTGFLGLGSKTPLIVSDSFSMISWWGGKKYVYMIFFGETGVPEIALMDESCSDERSGVEVSVSVKDMDINSFVHKAEAVYSVFQVKPKIIGASIDLSEEPGISGELSNFKWKYNKGFNSYLVMGNVRYPIAKDNYRYAHVTITAPIGSVDVTASREALEYTAKTSQYLADALASFKEELRKISQEEIDKAPTYVDAAILAKSLPSANYLYKGKLVNSFFTVDTTEPFYSYRGKNRLFQEYFKYGFNFVCGKTVLFCMDCVDAKSRFQALNNRDYLLISQKDWNTLKAQSDIYPDSVLLRASNLPKIQQKKYGKAEQGFILDTSCSKISYAMKKTGIDLNAGGVYIEVNGFKCDYDYETLKSLCRNLTAVGVCPTIYMLRKQLCAKVKSDHKWVTFGQYLKDLLDKNRDKIETALELQDFSKYHTALVLNKSLLNTELTDLLAKIDAMMEIDREEAKRYLSLATVSGYDLTQVPHKNIKSVTDKYPLFFFCLDSIRYELHPEFANYLKERE